MIFSHTMLAATPTRAAAKAAPAKHVSASQRVLEAKVPNGSNEAVLVTSPSASSTYNTVTLWRLKGNIWHQVGAAMQGRDGLNGWSSHRVRGDLKTPIGVFSLSAAGGSMPNPGTNLPYEQNRNFFFTYGSFLGRSIVGIYDYVVPIDFNRVPGTPVSNRVEPDGSAEGGGIWMHISNGTATAGCVTLTKANMVRVVRFLNTHLHPVIVMGPA